jgi:hypothetical protein
MTLEEYLTRQIVSTLSSMVLCMIMLAIATRFNWSEDWIKAIFTGSLVVFGSAVLGLIFYV